MEQCQRPCCSEVVYHLSMPALLAHPSGLIYATQFHQLSVRAGKKAFHISLSTTQMCAEEKCESYQRSIMLDPSVLL